MLIAQIAKEAFDNTPRVPTFVVALESGESLAKMNVIALAGGTGHVHLIHGGDVGAELANDLLGISTTSRRVRTDLGVLEERVRALSCI